MGIQRRLSIVTYKHTHHLHCVSVMTHLHYICRLLNWQQDRTVSWHVYTVSVSWHIYTIYVDYWTDNNTEQCHDTSTLSQCHDTFTLYTSTTELTTRQNSVSVWWHFYAIRIPQNTLCTSNTELTTRQSNLVTRISVITYLRYVHWLVNNNQCYKTDLWCTE